MIYQIYHFEMSRERERSIGDTSHNVSVNEIDLRLRNIKQSVQQFN